MNINQSLIWENDNDGLTYEIDLDLEIWRESYGQDVDGNRGEYILETDWDIVSIEETSKSISYCVLSVDSQKDLYRFLREWVYENAGELYNQGVE